MNAFSNRIGTTIEEGVINALNLGSDFGTRNIGLLVERERGIPGLAVLVTNPKDDQRIFGGKLPSMYSPYVVQELFANAGGYTANVTQIRIVGTGSLAASVIVTSNDGAPVSIMRAYAGRMGQKDPGTWANANLKLKVYPVGNVNGVSEGYLMEVIYKGRLVERYVSVGAVWQSLIDQVNARSEYVMLEAMNLGTALTGAIKEATFANGTYVEPEIADFMPTFDEVTAAPEGLELFSGLDVQIVAVPEVISSAFASAADDWARKTNKFFLFSLPYLATETVMETYYNALFDPNESFVASILPWQEVTDALTGAKVWIPAIGYALGAGYVRKAGLFNGVAWTPPAGVETYATGITRFTHTELDDVTLSRYVTKWRTNIVKFVKRIGYCLWSSRTYSNNSLFESIHVRLETNWMVENLLARNDLYMQKLYSPSLRKDIQGDNTIWMKNLYEQGGVERSLPFEEAVIVTVEQGLVNRKEAELEIAWIPPECIEHVHIRLSRNDGAIVRNALA